MNERSAAEGRTNVAVPVTTKINITMLADLLSFFDGRTDMYETWEKQVLFLKQTYNLNDDTTKILIGTRLKGKAAEWFHSKPEYITLATDDLLRELKKMFHHRPNRIVMRRRFEERVWRKTETFHDYVHEKTILANHLALEDDEILSYVVDGIPDTQLRDVARLHEFESIPSLLRAFEEISLRDRCHTTHSSAKQERED